MSCCGNKREEFLQSLSSQKTTLIPVVKTWSDMMFEYIGQTSLVVKGSVSGNVYRFSKTGVSLLVDYRDVSGMMAVPMLKKLPVSDQQQNLA